MIMSSSSSSSREGSFGLRLNMSALLREARGERGLLGTRTVCLGEISRERELEEMDRFGLGAGGTLLIPTRSSIELRMKMSERLGEVSIRRAAGSFAFKDSAAPTSSSLDMDKRSAWQQKGTVLRAVITTASSSLSSFWRATQLGSWLFCKVQGEELSEMTERPRFPREGLNTSARKRRMTGVKGLRALGALDMMVLRKGVQKQKERK